jgi:hypothetical protein
MLLENLGPHHTKNLSVIPIIRFPKYFSNIDFRLEALCDGARVK